MTDYTANFAAPRRKPDMSPLAKDATTMAGFLVRAPFLVRKAGPMSPARQRFLLGAPLIGMSIGAVVATAREGIPSHGEFGDVLPSVASMAVIGVTGAAAEVALYNAIVGERPRLTIKRAVALSLTRGALAVVRRRAVDATTSRFNPTKRALARIQSEMVAEQAVQAGAEVAR